MSFWSVEDKIVFHVLIFGFCRCRMDFGLASAGFSSFYCRGVWLPSCWRGITGCRKAFGRDPVTGIGYRDYKNASLPVVFKIFSRKFWITVAITRHRRKLTPSHWPIDSKSASFSLYESFQKKSIIRKGKPAVIHKNQKRLILLIFFDFIK